MKTRIVGSLLIAALGGIPASGLAQMKGMCEKDGMCKKGAGTDMGSMGGMHDIQMGMGGDMMEMKRLMHVLSYVGLTSEQIKALKRLRLQHQKESIPLHAKVQQATIELDELALAEKPDLKKMEATLERKT